MVKGAKDRFSEVLGQSRKSCPGFAEGGVIELPIFIDNSETATSYRIRFPARFFLYSLRKINSFHSKIYTIHI
jgi:hypothetical protein